ncbi:MAG: FAD-dependent oxidoreductase [Mycoplasmatales bacterium]|nr:FAD-dependent oxidoreductase [Mycoplasmatales bacterium]
MKSFDVVIIGSGPAGLTAALYLARNELSVAFIEKEVPGGKLVNISKIENWIGFESIEGADLSLRMYNHALSSGAQMLFGTVTDVLHKEKIVILDNEEIKYKKLIIASGTSEKVPHQVKNIDKFNRKGVSYCAICDGAVYKKQVVGVIGGGNSAIEEASFLASVAKEVHVFVRSKIRADKNSITELKNKSNVTIHLETELTSINGNEFVESVTTNKGETIEMKAVFPYIGLLPNTSFVKNLGITDEFGFIKVNKNMETECEHVYSVGDVNAKEIRQISTAVSDGSIAAKNIINKLG